MLDNRTNFQAVLIILDVRQTEKPGIFVYATRNHNKNRGGELERQDTVKKLQRGKKTEVQRRETIMIYGKFSRSSVPLSWASFHRN